MNTKQERELLKTIFPHEAWAIKVDKMSDAQVIAILLRLRNEGKV